MTAETTIYVWCNSCSNEWHSICAMGDDGRAIAGHVCSDHYFIEHDMGFVGDWKHDAYDEAYPDGWRLELVEDPKTHPGLLAAYKLNQALAKDAAASAESKP